MPLHAEEATFDTRYGAKGGTAFGVGGGARVWRGVWLAGAWAPTSHRHGVDTLARLPHPFRFDDFRTLEGSRSGLKREETGVHFQVMYRLRLARRYHVGIFMGPSWIDASRDLVDAVAYDDEYPYDTATFTGMTIVNASAKARTIGFGADVRVDVLGPLSVGVEVRRAAAKVDFETPAGGRMRMTVGGTQALVGALVLF